LTLELLERLELDGFDASLSRDEETRDKVERAVARVGVEAAAVAILAEVETERASGVEPKEHLGWYREVIATAGKPKANGHAKPESEPGCAEWAKARELVKQRVRVDLWERFFQPLTGRLDGNDLVLTAPDAWHAQFTADTYRDFLAECAGRPVRLEPVSLPGGAS
jgi:hypothetical protein